MKEKEEMLMICDDIKNECDRLTSGNFMHNRAAIKLLVTSMVNAINRAFPEEWKKKWEVDIV